MPVDAHRRPLLDDRRPGGSLSAHRTRAVEQLLRLVDDRLRQLASKRLANEPPGQTLHATALVHVVNNPLVGADDPASHAMEPKSVGFFANDRGRGSILGVGRSSNSATRGARS